MYKVCQGIKCTNTCILYIKEFINLIHNSYINHAKMNDSNCSPLTKKNSFPQHLNGDHFLTSSYLYFN